MKKNLFYFLKKIASPGFIYNHFAIIFCYLLILVIFPLDFVTGSQVSMHVLYVFPISMIALHSLKYHWVIGATLLAILVQTICLFSAHDINHAVKIYLFLMIAASNSTFALIARFARINTLEVSRLATIDPLTKLNNRRSLETALDNEIIRQRRYGGIFSLALIDLDGFKKLNDAKGHHVGDKALILLADILRNQTRESDTIARIGGDEFVILMPNTNDADCDSICQLLCQKISLSMEESSYPITASIGYTTTEKPPKFGKDVLHIADQAMYQAKFKGKSRVIRGYENIIEN